MTYSRDAYERIRALIQDAALNDARWPAADRMIGEVNRTRGSALGLGEGQSPADGSILLARICLDGERREDWEHRYFSNYFPDDERIPRWARLENGRITPAADLYTDEERKASPAYNEALAEMRAQNGLYLRMDGPDGLHVGWLICDSSERGGWSSDQVRLIQRLRPHVRQFAIMRHALAEAEVTGPSTTELLTSRRYGVIHLDRRGRIMEANDRAADILRQGDGLADFDAYLCTRMPADNAELSRLMARALPPFGERGSAGSMRVARSSSETPLAVHIAPVGEEYPHFRTRRIGAVVLIADPSGPARIDPARVAAILDLTPTEGRLVVALATGRTLRDVALATGRTEETVRWHLKQIFRKQGVSRQVDLVRRVLALDGFADLPD
ncbi:helix-turn-helix transcriptional regulator [Candidatus Palauibacter soopunensis]|uniref:helix-turn-helix transcriptional regulator n=1 Tax=Candidatus Palauibacter soopunensis TaxID=3056739 RepID=UPI002394717C|nr:helix-turn-helix transcriptional regulator [Candidatus Palauibacter soopunensis]MDE2879415.1 helix-turn-helix transcriptional regulator [Candidatus Palauibacter soopunensis]